MYPCSDISLPKVHFGSSLAGVGVGEVSERLKQTERHEFQLSNDTCQVLAYFVRMRNYPGTSFSFCIKIFNNRDSLCSWASLLKLHPGTYILYPEGWFSAGDLYFTRVSAKHGRVSHYRTDIDLIGNVLCSNYRHACTLCRNEREHQ